MISNSSPIIFLSKINQLNLLKKLFRSVFITNEIKDEILVKDKPGNIEIKRAIKDGWIKIVRFKRVNLGIKGAESSVINLARHRKDKLLIDDAIAIKVAKALGIKTIRTTTIIFMAFNKGIIRKKQALSLINRIIEVGYYISPRYYAAILEKLSG